MLIIIKKENFFVPRLWMGHWILSGIVFLRCSLQIFLCILPIDSFSSYYSHSPSLWSALSSVLLVANSCTHLQRWPCHFYLQSVSGLPDCDPFGPDPFQRINCLNILFVLNVKDFHFKIITADCELWASILTSRLF